MFTEAGVPVTVYGVASALARSPDQVAAMADAGWEIASHGLKWIDYRDHAEEVERADLVEAIRLHKEVVGERPAGLYVGRTSVNSVKLAAAEGGFAWISDTYDDDLPYWLDHDGHGNAIPPQLVIPYTLDANDMRFATPNARIMVHQPSGGFQGQASDIERHAQDIIKLKRRLNEVYVKHTGKDYETIEKTLDRDHFMTADEARDFGLIDKVIESRDPVEASAA